MRGVAAYLVVARLRGLGRTYDEIAATTGVSRSTVARWLTHPPRWIASPRQCRRRELVERHELHATYAYVLGLYLGDGHIVRMHNGVYKLSV